MNSIIYAVGDVHGRSDLLSPLIDFVDKHSRKADREPRVYFLGDIVDRGHDSRGALEIVRKTLEHWPGSRLILGNHEDMFLKVYQGPFDGRTISHWLGNGGQATIGSYVGPTIFYDLQDVASIAARFPEHFLMMMEASMIETVGRYAFTHAGIDPRVPIDAQSDKDLMWIKEEFLDHVGPLSHVIVHGHTVQDSLRPVVTENRISLDTGAYDSGILSMAAIDPETDEIEFFSTTPDRGTVPVEPIRLDRGFGTILDGQDRPIGRDKRSAA